LELLLATTFSARAPDGALPAEVSTIGDLALGMRTAADPRAWLEAVVASDPTLAGRAPWVLEIALDSGLREPDWDPAEDSARDGMLLVEPWDLAPEGPFWRGLPNSPRAQQAAALVHAPLAAIKAAENDYRRYLADPRADYEVIYPLADSYVRGEDPLGNPFAALRIRFRCDLPLWYGDYSCELQVLNRVDSSGRFVCDIASTSADFHWLAGRDVYLPVETNSGLRVAYLVVRQYGFDLEGVPDRERDVREALRASLGSLKLHAERSLAPVSAPWRPEDEDPMPAFRVLGLR
jgi:hypothetical protein